MSRVSLLNPGCVWQHSIPWTPDLAGYPRWSKPATPPEHQNDLGEHVPKHWHLSLCITLDSCQTNRSLQEWTAMEGQKQHFIGDASDVKEMKTSDCSQCFAGFKVSTVSTVLATCLNVLYSTHSDACWNCLAYESMTSFLSFHKPSVSWSAKGLSPGPAPKDGLGVVGVTGHWRGIS